jgi:16S rRNA (guanine966-N2)-methyltransferase
MKLHIISGKFGSRSIDSPDSKTTHPMNERVRGSLFNIINDVIPGAEVLDAFAGTGSLGLEALSRGASSVTFVERDKLAGKILDENVKLLEVESTGTIVKMGLSTWISKNQEKRYDLIFVDPPYDDMQLSTVCRLFDLLKLNGLMVLSYPGRGELPTANEVVVVDNRSYGTAALAFYRRK